MRFRFAYDSSINQDLGNKIWRTNWLVWFLIETTILLEVSICFLYVDGKRYAHHLMMWYPLLLYYRPTPETHSVSYMGKESIDVRSLPIH